MIMIKRTLIFLLFISFTFSASLVKVVYTTDEFSNGFLGLAIVDIDGTNKTDLSNNEYNEGGDLNVDVSNDGKKIVFRSNEAGNEQIFIMDIDGENRTQLTNSINGPQYAHFSPNDELIYFTDCPFNCNLVVMDTSGVIQDTIFEGGDWGFYDSFDTDGTKILYTDQLEGDNSREVYMMNLEDGSTVKLTDNSVNDHSPMFIPYDQSKILFTRTGSGLYKMDVNNYDEVLLTSYEPGRHLDFSNDIYTIILSSIGDGTQLYLAYIDGQEVTALTDDSYQYKNPKFVQYGGQEKILYESNPSTREIFIMDLDGSNSVSISDGNARYPHVLYTVYEGPVWRVATTGSDQTGDGSEANPFATIQTGIDSASNGDTILVHEGVYHESVNVDNRELTIGSMFMLDHGNEDYIDNTVLDGQNSYRLIRGSYSQISLIGITIINGFDDGYSGAIGMDMSDLTISDCRFRENYAGANGGVMNLNGTNLNVSNSDFYNNSSERASVINIGNHTETGRIINININKSKFRSNIGQRRGAINVWGSDTTSFTNCEFFENISGSYGGGFIVHSTNYLSIDSCNISNNTAINGTGGGLSVWSIGEGVISNSLISNNLIPDTAEYSFGGGISLWADAEIVIRNCTITNNSSNKSSGIRIKHNSHCNIINSIIWGNESTEQIGIYDDLFEEDTASTLDISFSNLQYGIDSIYVDELSSINNYDNLSMINLNPLFCNADSSDYALAENSPCVDAGENDSNLGSFGIGCDAILSISEELFPVSYTLNQNYPNPFNPVTTLRYDLPENSLVNITIYDMMGRQVKTLVNQAQDAGYKSVIWNATNDYGKPVSAGIYLYQIQAGEYISTKKMVLLK